MKSKSTPPNFYEKKTHFASLNSECVESTSFTTTEQTDTTVDYRLSAAAATTRLQHKGVMPIKFMPKKDSSQTENDISRYVDRFIEHYFKSLIFNTTY